MRVVRVAIAGLGGIGRAAAEMLLSRRTHYAKAYDVDVRLVAVGKSRAAIVRDEGLALKQIDQMVEGQTGPDVLLAARPDILIEAGPTNFTNGKPGIDYISPALEQGIHAIVISKGALVLKGHALQEQANRTGVQLKVSGACGAALPTIDLIRYGLAGCEITAIEGVLNASTNRLLDLMRQGQTLEDAVAVSRAEGIMESDPSKDIEGWDTAAKLLIIANLGLGTQLTLDDIQMNGIQNVTPVQIAAWQAEGRVPKLVGRVTLEDGQPKATVRVEGIEKDHAFATAHGSTKAFCVHTKEMGPIITLGCGPEPIATAAAALKDLEHILQELSK